MSGKPEYDIFLTDEEVERRTTAFARRVGARVRELREMLEMTADDMARYGINRSTVSRVENGHLNLTAKTAVRFAIVLGVRPWELYAPSETSELRPKRGRSARPTASAVLDGSKRFRRQIGGRVRSLRAMQGISPIALSELAGVTLSTIIDVERAASNLRSSTAVRLADAIGVQPHELYLPTEQSGIRLAAPGEGDE
mgnify:FL=1